MMRSRYDPKALRRVEEIVFEVHMMIKVSAHESVTGEGQVRAGGLRLHMRLRQAVN